jgi:ABC-type cobalamin/Fe3+-siderophores transport system ATPase subunit
MITELYKVRDTLLRKQGQKDLLIEQKKVIKKALNDEKEYYDLSLKARAIIQIVAESTQKSIEYHISNLVTMALSSVFPEPYEFQLRFTQRRNKTEADLIFIKQGKETDDILNTGGGGVADIASLALRMSLWSIKKTRPVFLLDEPTKFLHNPIYQEKCSEMIKEVSRKLNLQVIMISDQQSIIKSADKVINVENIKGVSKVK